MVPGSERGYHDTAGPDARANQEEERKIIMEMGQIIRDLRREAGVTQEQLAEALNVSFQAVSKWETGAAMPDIAMLPLLARYFHTTTDTLLGFDREKIMDEVMAVVAEAYRFRVSDPARSRAVLEEGLKRYPGNDVLLGNILYTIDPEKEPDRMIAAAARQADRAKMIDMKLDAMQFLAKAYAAKGDRKSARAVLDDMPEMYFTKLELDAELLDDEDGRASAEKQKWLSFEQLLSMMRILARHAAKRGDRPAARAELRRALALADAMAGEERIARFDGLRREIEEQLAALSEKGASPL